jgi:hypothetical protein
MRKLALLDRNRFGINAQVCTSVRKEPRNAAQKTPENA